MKRRDFFKALAAASAALAASRTAVAAVEPPKAKAEVPLRPLPGCSITADTQKMVADLLKLSAAISIARSDYAFDDMRHEVHVEYAYDPDGLYQVNLNDELSRFLKEGSAITGVRLTVESPFQAWGLGEDVPIIHEPERRIHVTYVVPS